MIDRTTKLRWRRLFKRRKRQVEQITVQAEQTLEENIIQRLSHLGSVWRFVAGWLILLVILAGGVLYQQQALGKYYQADSPQPGGIFTEGILGRFNTANPLYISSSADAAASKLVFAGLFTYDGNNKLIGDLASSLQVDDKGTTYTVMLRDNIFWHDGTPVTASDVVYTYKLIQNPDAKSALNSSWQGIKVEQANDRVVTFVLPTALSSFPHSLINGILPEHIVAGIEPSQLRSSTFNTQPVGAGPFKWQSVKVQGSSIEAREAQITFEPHDAYHRGAPKLAGFSLRIFIDENTLVQSFVNREINSISGLQNDHEELKAEVGVQEYSIPLTGAAYVFMKNSNPILADTKIRVALTQATDTKSIRSKLGFPVKKVDSLFLSNQIGYAKDVVQFGFDQNTANKTLDEAGWVRGADGFRVKDGMPLSLMLVTLDNAEYVHVAEQVRDQWALVGAKIEIVAQSDEVLQTNHIIPHSYDLLLYGISIGPDPDVFAYWHSSQADIRSLGRLNLSEWKNNAADQALEGGRTRLDASLRIAKYRPLAEIWRNEAPAIGLYQPRMLYVTRGTIYNFDINEVNVGSDRYANVNQWMIRTSKVVRNQ
jgi:peptide/nickel transport system substrate-binding protein